MRHWTLAAAATALVSLGLLSCDHSPTAPRLDQLALDVVSGDRQTGVVGTQLAPLIVKVTKGGYPVALQVLNFRVVSGGGSVYAGTELTDDHGIAQEFWTLGTRASEPQKLEVRAVESSTGAQKVFGTFTATATSAPASAISAQGGDGQTAVAGTQLPISPAVLVTDQFGNAIAGVTVNFVVTGGGGSIVNQSQATATNGIASAGTWTLGPQAGPNTLTATSTGLNGSPVTFTGGGTTGGAAQLLLITGNNQVANAGSTLPTGTTVRVTDLNGNGVPSVAVTFTVTGGGGSLDGVGSLTTLTDARGAAKVSWTLGLPSGPNTLQATAVGLQGSPIPFKATGLPFWSTKASMPTPRETQGAGVANGILYVVGGEAANDCTFLNTLEAYAPATNTWTTKTAMPTRRSRLAAGVVNGILYAVGGYTGCGPITGALEAYDPRTDTWVTKAPMPTPRGGLGVGVVNGILYAVGGDAAGTLEAYDPSTNTWTLKTSMPTPRAGFATAVLNGVIYAAGGQNSAGATVATVEAYDPTTDTWTTKASMSTVRFWWPGAGVAYGVLYVVGGWGVNGPLGTAEAYDATSNTWSPVASTPTVHGAGLIVGVVNGLLYAVGGYGSTYLATNEVYQP